MRLSLSSPAFWSSARTGLTARALLPVSWAVEAAIRVKGARATPFQADIPVLCCGNLTVGGTGKTILVRELAARLRARGETPHILTRGYGGKLGGPLRVNALQHTARDVGDEAFMLAAEYPVWIGPDRGASARLATESGATCLVMDDGLQNYTLHQDIRLTLIDGGAGLGNGRVLPAGPLRESSRRGLARSTAIVMIGRDETEIERLLPPTLPRLNAKLIPAPAIRRLQGRRIIAFAGIGRPQKFFSMLSEAGVVPMRSIPFPDHHKYSERDCRRLSALSHQPGVTLVTTKKDWVKLPEWFRRDVTVIDVELRWSDPAAPEHILDRLLQGL